MEVTGQPHATAVILLEKNGRELCIKGWVGPSADLDV